MPRNESTPLRRSKTFDNFIMREGTEDGFRACKAWAEGEFPFLTLAGDVGAGKTHLAQAALHHMGKDKRFQWEVSHLMDWLKEGIRDSDIPLVKRMDSVMSYSALVLDDLGAEPASPWVQSHLKTLIDYRQDEGLPTIVTTNLKESLMAKQVGKRLASRIYAHASGDVIVAFLTADDYRTGKDRLADHLPTKSASTFTPTADHFM